MVGVVLGVVAVEVGVEVGVEVVPPSVVDPAPPAGAPDDDVELGALVGTTGSGVRSATASAVAR